MLRQEIQDQMKQAMKNKEVVRLETLRFLWSQIRNSEIDKKEDLVDDQIVALIRSERKKREEMIGYLKKAGKHEEVVAEEAKLSVLLEYIEEMSRDEIEKLVDDAIGEGIEDFGQLMGKVMGLTKGQADGKVVSEVVREKLNDTR